VNYNRVYFPHFSQASFLAGATLTDDLLFVYMPKKPAPAPTMTLTKALWAFVGRIERHEPSRRLVERDAVQRDNHARPDAPLV
jgi:hypothetical protein